MKDERLGCNAERAGFDEERAGRNEAPVGRNQAPVGRNESEVDAARSARPRTSRMSRVLGTTAIACAVLASVACATESGLATTQPDLFDEPAASSPPSSSIDGEDDADALRDQGEAAYRARRFDEAVGLYERAVVAQPSDAQGWLRLGNIHHQRRDWFKALRSYRRAAARTRAGVEADPAVRAKALYNLALVNLELARQTLRTLERMGEVGAVAGDTGPVARAIESTQRALESVASRTPVATPVSAPRAQPVSRHTREKLPVVDYIRGEPQP